MNINEDKLLNKSAEDIANDFLVQSKNNSSDALNAIDSLLNKDGLSTPLEVKLKVAKNIILGKDNGMFRNLIMETKTKMDKIVEFLIDHRINPSVLYRNLPLYDKSRDSLIILKGVDEKSPYFKNEDVKEVYPDDRVIIQPYTEERVPEGNFYTKTYGEPEIIYVKDFMEIYEDPINEETRLSTNTDSLDSQEEIDNLKNTYFSNRKQQDQDKERDFKKWVEQNGNLFDLDKLSEPAKMRTLKDLYIANKKGFELEDLPKLPLMWAALNKDILDIYTNKIKKEITDKDQQNALLANYKQTQKDWFKQSLYGGELLKATKEWWKEVTSNKEESILSEGPKTNPIKDQYQLKKILKQIGIDPKYTTVPITVEPMYNTKKYQSPEEDPNAAPLEKFIITAISDQNNLTDDTGKVRVRSMITNDSYEMNIGDVKHLAEKPINVDAELDTTEFRIKDKHQFDALNKGMGKFIDIPEEVIIEMLKTVNKENPGEFPIDLVKYYQRDKSNPLIIKALSMYNQGFRNYVIRKFNKDGQTIYRGFVPYEEYPNSRPTGGSKNKYQSILDY